MCKCRCKIRRTTRKYFHGKGEGENTKIFARNERGGSPHNCDPRECSRRDE
jgi:hypothetical protein